MKRLLLAVICLGVCAMTSADDTCVKKVKDYYGSKYFNKCHCSTMSYPDVAEALKPLGVVSESRWVVCSTFDGGEWCVCGVQLSWLEQPADKEVCEARKKEVKALTDKFVSEKKDFGVSAPLICR